MKFFYICWVFVLISSALSGVIFLIAACEKIPMPIPNRLKTEVIDNSTVNYVDENEEDLFITSSTSTSKVQSSPHDEVKEKQYSNEQNGLEKKDNVRNENKKEEKHETKTLKTLTENLTQQPNLSQGISETGQAVILTLVDTPSLELHSLAEPHFSVDDYTQISPSNLSQATSLSNFNSDINIETSSKSQSTTVVNYVNTDSNETSSQNIQEISQNSASFQNDQVVVVRAEQKTFDGSVNQPESSRDSQASEETHKSNEEAIKPEDGLFSTSGELGQETIRAKLVSGSSDEAATVVLDGFIGSGSSEHHEDIPSFSEWAQKRLEEAEKKKSHPNASLQNPGTPGKNISGMKIRSKNYASPDCGAKIVAVNPEARSARNVLVSTRDEYMLNTCTSKIWFVVELCEAIQAKKIELANFELFSSSPKDFSVFVSDRFPTREWSPVGQFTAKDERDIQSFTLHPHLFGKFIRLELHSHYGSEHFCPISLFRTYGTSEFEVLETETEIQEPLDNEDNDDDDQVLDSDSGENTSKNLFGSARDAVIRIVKKAADILVQSSDSSVNNKTESKINNDDKIKNLSDNCLSLKYNVLCNNCTNDQFTKVFQLLSCRASYLDSLLKISFFSQTFYQDGLCEMYEINVSSSITKNTLPLNRKKVNKRVLSVNNLPKSFITSIFSQEYIISLCNVIAVKERQLSINSSLNAHGETTQFIVEPHTITSTSEISENVHKILTKCVSDLVDCKAAEITSALSSSSSLSPSSLKTTSSSHHTSIKIDSKTSSSVNKIKISETIASQIKPTKTLNRENIKRESSVPVLEPSKDSSREVIQADVVTTPSPLVNSVIPTLNIPDESSLFTTIIESTISMTASEISPIKCEIDSNMKSLLIKNVGDSMKHESENNIEVEIKKEKLQVNDKDDIKFNSQDQLNLDSLLSDLKDLENDSPPQGSSSSVVTHATVTSTPQQKESVFLRLSNRIKTLERNMSLSSQYLEELSRRYKKQVEELQRALERATVAMGEEVKKGEEKDIKHSEEIAILKEQMLSLSQTLDELLYDKNSWKSKLSTFGQHILLIFIEIAFLIIIVLVCRKTSDSDLNFNYKTTVDKEISRRKSAESVTNNVGKKKKRRPSEIASRVMGTYKDLMIDEKLNAKNERRNKKKNDFLLSNLKRDSSKLSYFEKFSSIDHIEDINSSHSNVSSTKSDSCSTWLNKLSMEHDDDDDDENTSNFKNNQVIIEEIQLNNSPESQTDESAKNEPQLSLDNIIKHSDNFKNSSSRGIKILKNAKLHSPSFMKTALCTRSKREKIKNNESPSAHQIFDNWEWYSRASDSSRSERDSPLNFNVLLDSPDINHQNGDITNINEQSKNSENVESEHSILIPVKKVKKEGSLKKMVKKLF